MGRGHRRLPPHSFLAEGPRASRALSASRASSSPNSTGSSPAWPSPCRGRPSGRRGRTRRATMRACGLRPARRWASSACPCAGADQHRPNRNTRQDEPPSPHANPRLQLLGGFAGRTCPKRHNTPVFPQVGEAGSEQLQPKTAQKSRPMAKSAPVSCETIQKSRQPQLLIRRASLNISTPPFALPSCARP